MIMNHGFWQKIFDISTYRWHVKFDVDVFNNIKTNSAILDYKIDIAYTYW